MEKQFTPVLCTARDCNRSSGDARYVNLSFFCFPKDKRKCKIWMINSGRRDLLKKSIWYCSSYCHLCACHFEDCMFLDDLKTILRCDAIPTKFKSSLIGSDKGDKVKNRKLDIFEGSKTNKNYKGISATHVHTSNRTSTDQDNNIPTHTTIKPLDGLAYSRCNQDSRKNSHLCKAPGNVTVCKIDDDAINLEHSYAVKQQHNPAKQLLKTCMKSTVTPQPLLENRHLKIARHINLDHCYVKVMKDKAVNSKTDKALTKKIKVSKNTTKQTTSKCNRDLAKNTQLDKDTIKTEDATKSDSSTDSAKSVQENANTYLLVLFTKMDEGCTSISDAKHELNSTTDNSAVTIKTEPVTDSNIISNIYFNEENNFQIKSDEIIIKEETVSTVDATSAGFAQMEYGSSNNDNSYVNSIEENNTAPAMNDEILIKQEITIDSIANNNLIEHDSPNNSNIDYSHSSKIDIFHTNDTDFDTELLSEIGDCHDHLQTLGQAREQRWRYREKMLNMRQQHARNKYERLKALHAKKMELLALELEINQLNSLRKR